MVTPGQGSEPIGSAVVETEVITGKAPQAR
jgi:hypothetical protein